jgi:hypothetical protein
VTKPVYVGGIDSGASEEQFQGCPNSRITEADFINRRSIIKVHHSSSSYNTQRLPPCRDGLSNGSHTVRPLGKPFVQSPRLVRVQDPWLDPVDVGKRVDLVDRPLDQSKAARRGQSQLRWTSFDSRVIKALPQSLHYQMLDLGNGQLSLFRNRLEWHRSLRSGSAENRLYQRHQADLLA